LREAGILEFRRDCGPPSTGDLGVGVHPPLQRWYRPVAIGERTDVVCHVPITLYLAVG
jgi:hypothetical protein